jgi:hypothetical protein
MWVLVNQVTDNLRSRMVANQVTDNQGSESRPRGKCYWLQIGAQPSRDSGRGDHSLEYSEYPGRGDHSLEYSEYSGRGDHSLEYSEYSPREAVPIGLEQRDSLLQQPRLLEQRVEPAAQNGQNGRWGQVHDSLR